MVFRDVKKKGFVYLRKITCEVVHVSFINQILLRWIKLSETIWHESRTESLVYRVSKEVSMARPRKQGLDYFTLDCQLDEKMRLIQAQFGLKGFALVVKLLQKIYGEYGYYCEWTEDVKLMFIAENFGASKEGANFVAEVLKACIKRGIFSEDLFDKYSILTSSGIQKRFADAVKKREQVEMEKAYLLIKVTQKSIKLTENGVSDTETRVLGGINPQSKVKEKDILSKLNISRHESVRESEKVFFEDEKLNRAFIDFIAFRKELKKPLIGKGIDLAIKKLKDIAGNDNELAIKIIEQSMIREIGRAHV